MSIASDCGACLSGNHEQHDRNHGIRRGVIGGTYCDCSGDCHQRFDARGREFADLLSRPMSATDPGAGERCDDCEENGRNCHLHPTFSACPAEPDAGGVWLCSQCGELPSVMVKIGTNDGWCMACLDSAAESPICDPVQMDAKDVGALLCLCHATICPVHNEAAGMTAEYEVADLTNRITSALAAVRREAEVRALTEAADFIEQTSGIGASADDYTDGWYGALAYAIGDLRDRAARLGGA